MQAGSTSEDCILHLLTEILPFSSELIQQHFPGPRQTESEIIESDL